MRVARVALERGAEGALGGAVVDHRQDALEAPLLALRHVLLRRAGRGDVAVEAFEQRVRGRAAAAGEESQRLA
ncbi:hypothetical protein JZU54_01360, partial [bacterium]|nr:hypothetical protein [bacterium]